MPFRRVFYLRRKTAEKTGLTPGMAAFFWGLPPVGYFIGYLLSFGAVKWLKGRLRDADEGTVFLTLVAASLSIALGFGGLVTRVILKKSGIEMGALRIVRLNMEAVFCFMLASLFVSMFMPCQQCAPGSSTSASIL